MLKQTGHICFWGSGMFYQHSSWNCHELCLLLPPCPEVVKNQIAGVVNMNNVRFWVQETNDTWARDHKIPSLWWMNGACLLDFTFNGWEKSSEAGLDNQITRKAVEAGVLKGQYKDCLTLCWRWFYWKWWYGTLLTTSECLLSPHRNAPMRSGWYRGTPPQSISFATGVVVGSWLSGRRWWISYRHISQVLFSGYNCICEVLSDPDKHLTLGGAL